MSAPYPDDLCTFGAAAAYRHLAGQLEMAEEMGSTINKTRIRSMWRSARAFGARSCEIRCENCARIAREATQ